MRCTTKKSSRSAHASGIAWPALGRLFIVCLAVALASVRGPVWSGQDRYDYDALGRLIRHTDPAGPSTDYVYDPAGNILSVIGPDGATPAPLPVLSSVSPAMVRHGETRALTLVGQGLAVGTLRTDHPGLALSQVRQQPGEIRAELTVSPLVPTGERSLIFASGRGTTAIALQVAPALPTITLEPSPLALPPDNKPHAVTIRLSGADVVPHEIALASADTSRLTVSPANVRVPAGQTTVQVQVQPKTAGFVNLQITSPLLAPLTVPVFITPDFRGVNTSIAYPVGVTVGPAQRVAPPPSGPATVPAPRVGVAVGPVLTSVSPRALSVGESVSVTVQGLGLPAGLRLSVLPPQGIDVTLDAATATDVRLTLTAQAHAAAGARRLVVTDAAGRSLRFADPAQALLQLTTGQPAIDAIEPLFGLPGTTLQLTVRGRHLQGGRLALLPGTDLQLDAQPTVNAQGTELRARVQVAPLAEVGPRTVQVVTPSGQSATLPSAANQFTLVREIREAIAPIAAPLVGVRVGGADAGSGVSTAAGTFTAPRVGVVKGTAALRLIPSTGVRGTEFTLEVQGTGLQAVTSVQIAPADGLTQGVMTVNPEGTRVSIPLSVAADAPLTLRRVVLAAASRPLVFSEPGGAQFRVVAPTPQLLAVEPQVIVAGTTTTVSVRGRNLTDVTGVRLEPPQGVTVGGAISAEAGGTVLRFPVQVAADAPSGPRTVVVQTAGGASPDVPEPANTLAVARSLGPTYDAITAPLVGVAVGAASNAAPPGPAPAPATLAAPLVGVVLTPPPSGDAGRPASAFASQVGVVVGSVITSFSPRSPDGLLRGTTAVFTVTGSGLDRVTGVAIVGPAGVSAGTPVVDADGKQLRVAVTASATAASGAYGLRLLAPLGPQGAAGARLTALPRAQPLFHVGALPTAIDSISPIVLEPGQTYTFTIRGQGLRDVYQVLSEPGAGLAWGVGGVAPAWSTDVLGEKLSVPVAVDPAAPPGSRVIRLRVPGGLTGAEPTPATTFTVVPPQSP